MLSPILLASVTVCWNSRNNSMETCRVLRGPGGPVHTIQRIKMHQKCLQGVHLTCSYMNYALCFMGVSMWLMLSIRSQEGSIYWQRCVFDFFTVAVHLHMFICGVLHANSDMLHFFPTHIYTEWGLAITFIGPNAGRCTWYGRANQLLCM